MNPLINFNVNSEVKSLKKMLTPLIKINGLLCSFASRITYHTALRVDQVDIQAVDSQVDREDIPVVQVDNRAVQVPDSQADRADIRSAQVEDIPVVQVEDILLVQLVDIQVYHLPLAQENQKLTASECHTKDYQHVPDWTVAVLLSWYWTGVNC